MTNIDTFLFAPHYEPTDTQGVPNFGTVRKGLPLFLRR